jgi:hypothetical protein
MLRLEEAEAMADRDRNRDPALRSGPCVRLASQASGPTPGLSASVGDKGLAFLELRGAPGPRTPASAHLARFSAWGSGVPGSASEASGEAGVTVSL